MDDLGGLLAPSIGLYNLVYTIISIFLTIDYFWRIGSKAPLKKKILGLLYPLNIGLAIDFRHMAEIVFSLEALSLEARMLLWTTLTLMPTFVLALKGLYLRQIK